MKKVLLIAIFSIFFSGVFGQSGTTRVTVITHGFTAGGNKKIVGGIDDWQEFALRIRKKTGGTVYTNNIGSGEWQILNPYKKNGETLSNGTGGANEHKIFLYNWATYSNDPSDGSLESSADNLFALLCNSPIGNIFENYWNTHFIGHSRGNILLLQVAHRVAFKYPSKSINQFTLLDPHPAIPMNDASTSESNSLPGIYGNPTSSLLCIGGYDNVGTLKIKLPSNIIKADEYYRQDGLYEFCLNNQISTAWVDFDGIPVEGLGEETLLYPQGKFRRKLNNTILGGTLVHSSVWQWYMMTIDQSLSVPNSNWFAIANPNPINPNPLDNYLKVSESPLIKFENRVSTGYYYSNEGGGYNSLSAVNSNKQATLSEMNQRTINRTGETLNPIFNRKFQYGKAGWNLNGGHANNVLISNGQAKIFGDINTDFRHSLMLIPSNASTLRVHCKSIDLGTSILVRFYNSNGASKVKIFPNGKAETGFGNFSSTNTFVNKYFAIPDELKGQTGTFSVSIIKSNSNSIITCDEVQFMNSTGQNLRIADIPNTGETSSPTYFDFSVTYNVNPTLLIKGVQPTAFNAIIKNTLQNSWSGTLTMTWRKVTDLGKGISLASKGVNLAPNATVTLDRGTQQIISEAGEYVLSIYANNDTDPIDRYYFYVEEPDEIISSTISVTPSTSNYTFGDVTINTTKSQTFTIKNTSTASVNISNYVLTGTGFTQGTTTCCGTLAPNQSYDVTVNFLPNAPSAFNGQLQINGTFTDAPINIALSGVGVYTTPPSTGCLESSLASVNIQSGNTDALKQQFFTLTNTSLTGSVNVTGIGFTGADASYFSYDGNLFSVPSSLNPSFTTGFLVKFNNPQNTTRTYNANLVLTTNNTSCPTLSIPVFATHTPSTITWVSPPQDQTYEVDATSPYNMPLQWQGILPPNVSLDIQYTLNGGQTWTSKIDSQGQTCTIGNDNSGVNTVYFPIDQYAGKDIQFRIKPCYENITPWKYSGICHIIQVGQPTIQMISPNGYEVLAGGSTVDLKWRNLIGYQSVSLSYTTNNGVSWQTIASNLSGQATYYRWLVPTGVKSSECRIKITAANVSDESDNKFTIQPALATPITYANLVIKPEGCGTTSVGGASFQLLGGTPPYYVAWIEAGIGDNTINASYVTTSVTGLRAGTNRCVVTDANYNKVLYTFDIPQKGIYNYTPYVTKAICNGANGVIDIRTTGDFQFQNNAILSKDGTTVSSNFLPYFTGLTTGIYNLTLTNYDGCQQSTSLFVNATPGTLYTVTPTITNTSCGSTTGAISLNVGNAQSPTYLWSNGATTQNITGLAAGQYSVNVTDATGCIQTVRNDVVEVGGLVEAALGYQSNGSFNCFNINQNKLYFDEYRAVGSPSERLGIIDIATNTYDYLQIPSLYNSANYSNEPKQIEVSNTDIYTVIEDYKPNVGFEIHLIKIDKSSKQILNRIVRSGTNPYIKLQFIATKLYGLRADKGLDVIDFANNTVSNYPFSEDVTNFVFGSSQNKLYIIGTSTKLFEFDLTSNTVSRTGTVTNDHGKMIDIVGTTLLIAGYNTGEANTYVETFDLNSFNSTGRTVIRSNGNISAGKSFIKDNKYYIPTFFPNVIDVYDIQSKLISTIQLTVAAYDIAYSSLGDKILVNCRNSGNIKRLDNNKFDYTTAKTDASCGSNNGSITLTIPNDGKTYTYLWSNGATTKDITGLASGSYTVTVTQTGGCALKKTIVIAQLSTGITATLSPNSGTLCPSQTIILQPTAGSSYVWYKDNVVISGATSQTYSVSLAGVYKVVVTNSSGCSATSNNSTITTIPSPTANFTNVVSGNVVTFTNTSTNGNQYLWNFGDATTDTQFSPIKTYSGGGGTFTATLRVTNSCGVYSDISKSVTVSCTNMYTLKTGSWNDITVWSCGRVPTSTDIITVKANHFITIPASVTANAKNVIFEAIGGKFIYAANSSKLCLSCPSTIPTNGLIGYYPLNGNANDVSGNNLNGSIVGSITSITDRKGIANTAYQFSGVVLNYISIPDNALLCSNIITLNAWVNFAPTEGGYIINKGRDIQNGSYRLGTGGVAGQVLYNGVNDASYASVPTNQWVMVTGIINGNNAKYYVNGVMVSQATLSSAYVCSSAGNPLTIGNHYYIGVPNIWAYPYKGKIDDVRIYNRALSDAEVLNIYNAEKP